MQKLFECQRLIIEGAAFYNSENNKDKKQGEAQEADTWDNTFSKSIAMRNLVNWFEVSAPCASMWNHHLRIAHFSTKIRKFR